MKTVKAKCVKGRKQRTVVSEPSMANLPQKTMQERVFPVTNTGVDYFGPFEVKFLRKVMKKWCCTLEQDTLKLFHVWKQRPA